MTFRFGAADDQQLRAVLELLAVPQEAPGAIGGTSLAVAIAARLAQSGLGTSKDTAPTLRALALDALTAADLDAEAYWGNNDSGRWRQGTPTLVRQLAESVATTSLQTSGGNRADLEAAAALALGAAASAEVVASHNVALSPSDGPKVMMAGARPMSSPQLSISSSAGCWLVDQEGKTWLDATSGLWNVPLGHGHPEPISSLLAQLTRVAAINPFNATTPESERFAEELAALAGMSGSQVLFGSSGSEVIEAALRFGVAVSSTNPHARTVWALPMAFHGSTAGAADLSGFRSIRHPFPERLRLARSAPIDQWKSPGIGFVELLSGASGCETLSPAQLGHLEAFQEAGGFIVVDEVATGLGRAGWPTLAQTLGVVPDMLVLGKGLANGVMPIAALIVGPRVLDKLSTGPTVDFGHTHSNHPASIAAAAGCVRALQRLDHESQAQLLRQVARSHNVSIAGSGSMVCVQGPAVPRDVILAALRSTSMLCHIPTVADPVEQLILAPPLTASRSELNEMFARVDIVRREVSW